MTAPPRHKMSTFLSTLSLRRATSRPKPRPQNRKISIHALLAESDNPMMTLELEPVTFLSTLSLRRATSFWVSLAMLNANFYPRSPCGERHNAARKEEHSRKISIHALLAESDHQQQILVLSALQFLSTLSLRRATIKGKPSSPVIGISIHALLAESDTGKGPAVKGYWNFYPRSPCGERRCFYCRVQKGKRFLSTLSLRRATRRRLLGISQDYISIHALLAESDSQRSRSFLSISISIHALLAESDGRGPSPRSIRHNISIHALLAESDYHRADRVRACESFLSTLSLRRATNIPKAHGSAFAFLSTLSLRRATRRSTGTVQRFRYFYPRSPCGERLDDGARGFKIDLISIHALLAESDLHCTGFQWPICKFLSTLSLRRATLLCR